MKRISDNAVNHASSSVPASQAMLRRLAWSMAMSAMLIALVAAAMLVRKHFGATLPGCGAKSGCEALERSGWSRVPISASIFWPVSFLGLAHFAAMSAAWVASFRRVGITLGVIASIGLVPSLVFAGVMVFLGEFCVFCAAAHAANLVFTVFAWIVIRLDSRKEPAMLSKPLRSFPTLAYRVGSGLLRPGPITFAVVFAAVSGVLGSANASYEAQRAKDAEAERARSVEAIVGVGAESGASGSATSIVEQPQDRWGPQGFTGRYRKGPESASIRVVVLTDFQCPDCKRVEEEIMQAMKAIESTGASGGPTPVTISFSLKHFPMCKDCNKYVPQTVHGNACYGARAAEAAGILGGEDAFFKFVEWLFEVDGKFETKEILAKGVERAGLPLGVEAFAKLMEGDEPLRRIQADVEDGMALGLFYTPMVFINGVEMKGWQTPGSVKKSIEQIAATKPSAKTSESDRPVLAAQRFVDDWKDQPVRTLQDDAPAWSSGAAADYKPADAAKEPGLVDVVVFGDYTESGTAKFDGELRGAMRSAANVRYTFRHYPLNPECNPSLPPNVNKAIIRASSCLASRAVEAAGKAGGNSAYWKMHEWMMGHQSSISDAEVKKAAAEQGLDAGAFATALASAEVAAAIRDDALAAQFAGLSSLPTVFVNGKQVPRPMRDGDSIIKRIIEEAGKAK